MAEDPTLRPGDSFNIATQGVGSGSPISIATQGLLEPDVDIADIVTGGDGIISVRFTVAGQGGITTNGSVPVVAIIGGQAQYYYPADGGLVTGGYGDVYSKIGGTIFVDYRPTGLPNISLGGSATQIGPIVYEPVGGITTGGASDVEITAAIIGLGGLVTGGAADVEVTQVEPVGGDIVTGGAADIEVTFVHEATGGLVTGGAADENTASSETGTGGLITTGTAPYITLVGGSFEGVYPAFGGLVTGGAAPYSISLGGIDEYVYPVSGGITFTGTANVLTTKAYTADGGIITGGDSASDTGITLVYPSEGTDNGDAAIIIGGSAGVTDKPLISGSRGSNWGRRRTPVPHHFIYKAFDDPIKTGGEADCEFISGLTKGWEIEVPLEAPIPGWKKHIKVTVRVPLGQEVQPATPFADYYRDYLQNRELDKAFKDNNVFAYRGKGKKKISGAAVVEFYSRLPFLQAQDEEAALLDLFLNENDEYIVKSRYDEHLQKLRRDDDDAVALLD